jgi:hypothetical protein
MANDEISLKNNELWLMVKDKDSKKIKMHIKFDIQEYVHSEMMNVCNYINYVFSQFDDKELAIINEELEFDLTGLQALIDKNLLNDRRMENILYQLEKDVTKAVKWIDKTLDGNCLLLGCNIYKLRDMICGILSVKIKVNKFNYIDFIVEEQDMRLNNDIRNLITKYHNKINYNCKNCFRYFFNNMHIEAMKNFLIDFKPEIVQ